MRLLNKVALVTGGGSGIGRETAVLFAEEGARIVVADIFESSATQTADRIKANGGEALVVTGDVTLSEDAKRMVEFAGCSYDSLDILVNCAGVSSRNVTREDASEEEVWDRVMEINLKGTYLVTRHAVQEMIRFGGGSIINLASIMGLVGYPKGRGGFDPYPPSKGGVVQLTKDLAIEFAENNIRVNCICPGYVKTNLTEPLTSNAEVFEFLKDLHPMSRVAYPKEIAYSALFLASEDASFVTGIPLVVDGGYTAQ